MKLLSFECSTLMLGLAVILGEGLVVQEPSAYAFIAARKVAIGSFGKSVVEPLGSISFTYNKDGGCMQIKGRIAKLKPGLHGFHIHQYGDLSNGCTSAGGHYNPKGVSHASPEDSSQHVGDLGNIMADNTGVADVDMCVKFVHTVGSESVIERSVVVHEGRDDLGLGGDAGSLKTGNAGARRGCGVIGFAKPDA